MEPFSHSYFRVYFTSVVFTRFQSYTDQDMSSLSDPFVEQYFTPLPEKYRNPSIISLVRKQ